MDKCPEGEQGHGGEPGTGGLILKQLLELKLCVCLHQDQVPGTSTSTVLKNLDPDTEYTVTVVPVYPEMEGKPQSENGKTSE